MITDTLLPTLFPFPVMPIPAHVCRAVVVFKSQVVVIPPPRQRIEVYKFTINRDGVWSWLSTPEDLPRTFAEIIAHLHANPGKKFASDKLANTLSIAEVSILKNQGGLLKSGLFIREKRAGRWFYSAVSLPDLFPDLDSKALAAALVKLGD